MSRRWVMSADSLMPFSCRESTVEYSRSQSLRIVSTARTSFGDVTVPLKRRIGATVFDTREAQPVVASGRRSKHRAAALNSPINANHSQRGIARLRVRIDTPVAGNQSHIMSVQ